jgi:hypothetical protein
MPDLSFEFTLSKEEAAVFWDLCAVLQTGCSFREYSDLQLLTELQKRLAATKDKPEPIVMQITRTDAKNLWDLLAAVKITCRFSKFEGWQFVEDIQKKLQLSSSFAVARVTQNPAGSL